MASNLSFIVLSFSVPLPITPARETNAPGLPELVFAALSHILLSLVASPFSPVKSYFTPLGSVSNAFFSLSSSMLSFP